MTQHDTDLVATARQTARGEVPFEFHEIFTSRTDDRGVIVGGNDVFQRVSGFEWDELIKAPHKVVRHADMPKGAFFFKWAELKAGRAVSLYVKNRSKDGRYYWVFATAWPVEGGFQSIRIKPSSDVFQKVQKLYAEMLEAEAEQNLTPKDSSDLFLQRLTEMGYNSYSEFQSHAIVTEMEARSKQLGEVQGAAQLRFTAMREAIMAVRQETDQMTESFKAIRTVPMNMRIIASRLENAGGPISAISVNYGSMLDEMGNWVHDFVKGEDSSFTRMLDSIMNGMYLSCLSSLQGEMADAFRAQIERNENAEDARQQLEVFSTDAEEYRKRTAHALKVVEKEAGRLSRSVLDMKRYVTGLSSTRMMCKIESAALSGSDNSLAGIVEQLDACQDEIEDRLGRIVELNTVIQSNTAMLRAIG